ncbi:hypothetical protein EDD21DRAFT_385378 [Dissophora ornata]|nr:hypothetical protein BGZ58_006846 [Dissophora ornata]KAI8597465.1 hypothetical protein EDD21DRAFT_385378 [Dissophora ornata]
MKLTRSAILLSLSLVVSLTLLSTPSTTHALPTSLSSSAPKNQPKPALSTTSSPSKSTSKKKNKKPTNSPLVKKRQPSSPSSPSKSSSSPSEPDPPLLLLPDPNSVWHAGSVERVRWSKKYAKRLPKDTTVDIILVDSKTNKKIHSLKRFIPFQKGSAQVWVPSKLPEDASYMLVLELYDGRSQKPATVQVKTSFLSTTPKTLSTTTTTTSPTTTKANAIQDTTTSNSKNGKSIPSILRRSDINIARRARKVTRGSAVAAEAASEGNTVAQDINHDDYYKGHRENQPLEFSSDEFREEYPNVVQPIELEHTFGLHQKVYTMAPYTLEWKVPARVAELLEYTQTRLRLMMDKNIDMSLYHSLRDNNRTFVAKMLVELVEDDTLELVSVLVRNVPAETKFQYLQIRERVPQAFYRLRVQMVVVEIQGTNGSSALDRSDALGSKGRVSHGEYMEGWDFPSGGRVIDRYESITRRFWVAEGAL